MLVFGLFAALSLFGYDNKDWAMLGQPEAQLSNWGGPMGARLAHILMWSFGKITYVWPFILMAWGPLLFLGYVAKPKKRRFAAFFMMSLILASFIQAFFPAASTSLGHGGVFGGFVGSLLVNSLGFAGAMLFLTFGAVACLILTRNISLTRDEVKNWVGASNEEIERQIKGDDALPGDSEKPIKGKGKKKAAATDEDAEEDTIVEAPEPIDDSYALDLGPSTRAPAKVDSKMFKAKPVVVSKSKDESETMELLSSKLAEFAVKGEVTSVTQGPVVKTYEFEPAAGTKVAKVEALESDLARLLKAKSLRVVPVAGKSTIGFEIPNTDRKVIPFGNLIHSPEFKSRDKALPIAMGVDAFGKPVIEDLAQMPHLLVAGSTGSGKSVFINTLITSLLVRHSAKDLRMVLIDPKMVELEAFNNTAHMSCPVVTDVAKDGLPILNKLVQEMEERYNALKAVGAKNLPRV